MAKRAHWFSWFRPGPAVDRGAKAFIKPLSLWGRAMLSFGLGVALIARAQPGDQVLNAQANFPAATTAISGQFHISERGPHHRIWESSVPSFTNQFGQVTYRKEKFTELKTGLHHLTPVPGARRQREAVWVESSSQVKLTAGGAAATNAAHRVRFSANANTRDALELTTPEGTTLTSHVLCLSYFSPASGSNVVIARLQDSLGQLLAPYDQVLYTNALAGKGCQADILYKNSCAGLEQNILLHHKLPSPSAYGLDEGERMLLLQVWSEFTTTHAPKILPERVAVQTDAPSGTLTAESFFDDCVLDFGDMRIGRGKAFSIGDRGTLAQAAWVFKQWVVDQGRTFLVEQVPLEAIAAQLDALPTQASSPVPIWPGAGAAPVSLPQPREPTPSEGHSMNLAQLGAGDLRGFCLDYSIVQSQPQYTLQGDTTYYVSGPVNLGQLIVEGGAVVKFTNAPDASIKATNVVCLTGPYSPAVFTAADDSTIGQPVGGDAILTNAYGGVALDLSAAPSGVVLSNLHFRYLAAALAGTGITLRNAQIIQCQNGFGPGSRQAVCYNTLLHQIGTVIDQEALIGDTFLGEHVTAHYCTNFLSDASGTISLTNCLFVCVTNWQCSNTYTGAAVFLDSDAGVFQTVAAGGHYLAPFSPFRNVGNPNIDPTLLSEFSLKTTSPPVPLSDCPWSTNLYPCVQRERTRPDLGYCYSAIDYSASNSSIASGVLTIAPGTVIAYYDAPGLSLRDGAQIHCVGSPTSLIRFVDYRTVQDQPLKIGPYSGNSAGIGVQEYRALGVGSPAQFRFAAFSRMAGSSQALDFFVDNGAWLYNGLDVRDCTFQGGGWWLAGPAGLNLAAVNNVFERATINAAGPFSGAFYNNLFRGGAVSLAPYSGTSWIVRDNVFDSGTVDDITGDVPVVEDHNAFVNADAHLLATDPSDLVLSSLAYATGPLGRYYQASTNLVDKGSRPSPAAGLFHYTTQTNNLKEAWTQVDIGPHYVAVGSDALPVDTDGGGAPDYLENAAGDGNVGNPSETSWMDGSDDNQYLLVPGYLRCEYRVDPWGVDARDPVSGAESPRLYWTVSSPRRAAKQMAYQIQLGTSPSYLTNGLADVWDSGQVYSDRTIQVEYDSKSGQPLQSGQRLWWRVKSWDLASGLSAWSTNGFFQTGLLRPTDWADVNWISLSSYSGGGPCPMFRREFILTNRVQSATAYVSAKGVYELWVNGSKVGPNLLAPEWTDYHKRIQYQVFDLDGLLNSGMDSSTNVIAAVVGEGWFSGTGEVGNGACADIGAPDPQFALRLILVNADRSTAEIVTDPNWTAYTNGAIRSSSIIRGEIIDANQEGFHSDWAAPGYSKAGLFASSYLTTYKVAPSQMVAQPGYPIQATQTNPAVALWTVSNDETTVVKVYDLGQLIAGISRLTLHTGGNNLNARVTLEHAEVLQVSQPNNSAPNGPSQADIYTLNLNGISQAETFALNGEDVQTFQPHFTYHAFRFVRVTAPASLASDLTLGSLSAIVTRSAVPVTGDFVCYDTSLANGGANPLLTNNPVSRLMTNISWTIRNNLQGVFTSCGGRNERNGYFYDEHIVSQTACFDMDMAAFFTKTSYDIRDAQLPNGQYSIYAPNAVQYWPPLFADPGNQVGALIFPWRLYQNYGDTRVLDQHYASASSWINYITNRFPDGLWHEYESYANGVGYNEQFQVADWMHAGWFNNHPTGWYPGTNVAGLAGTNWGAAWYAYSADTLASMSDVLQQLAASRGDLARAQSYADRERFYAALAATVRSAYTNLANTPSRSLSYDSSNNLTNLFGNTQADCIMALAFNLVPDNQRSNVLNILLHGPIGIENFNSYFHTTRDLSTGYYCSPRAMLELTRDGYTDTAYRLLTDANFPCWLYLTFYGFTTCSENWNTYIFGPGTDHGYYAEVAASLSSFNHLPFAAVGEWVWEVVGGINLDESRPGFENVIIRPQPGGGVTNALASFQSIHGPILTCWTNDAAAKNFSLNVTIPANITASVYLVGITNLATINEGTSHATNMPGLLAPPLVTNGASLFQVGSGSYQFRAPLRPAAGKTRRKEA
jgi:alpha-L-rhamnosidase